MSNGRPGVGLMGTPPYAFTQLMQFVWPGLPIAQALYVAAKLGIADQLAAGAKTGDELAASTGSDLASLTRLLHVLATLGIFEADSAGAFRNSATGDLFRSDHPSSVRESLLVSLSPLFWRPLGELHETVRSGRPAFDGIFGESFFDWLAARAADSDRFAAVMNAATRDDIPLVLSTWDFSRYGTIVDVGGGRGALLAAILSAYGGIRGVLFDLPPVTARADALQSAGLAGRCRIVSGNFFDSVPNGADAYLLRSVIHDWNNERAAVILGNCRRAMRPGATLLVLERLLERGSAAELIDLHMMVLTGGRERSPADYTTLLNDAGFRVNRVARTVGPAIIEAIAV
jgi:SAM-dependent methyltransferase